MRPGQFVVMELSPSPWYFSASFFELTVQTWTFLFSLFIFLSEIRSTNGLPPNYLFPYPKSEVRMGFRPNIYLFPYPKYGIRRPFWNIYLFNSDKQLSCTVWRCTWERWPRLPLAIKLRRAVICLDMHATNPVNPSSKPCKILTQTWPKHTRNTIKNPNRPVHQSMP